jgi:hypothetical protein
MTGFRILLIGICIYGISLNLLAWQGNALGVLAYYTLQSNLVVAIFFIAWLFYNSLTRDKKPSAKYYLIRGAVTACITLTFIVFHFALRPTLFTGDYIQTYGSSVASLLLHYVVPLMVIADWLLFDQKGRFSKFDPLKWLFIPLAYLIFALVGAGFGIFNASSSRYPYFFIDIDKYGIGQVALNILVIAIGYAILCYLIYGIDKLLARKKKLKAR